MRVWYADVDTSSRSEPGLTSTAQRRGAEGAEDAEDAEDGTLGRLVPQRAGRELLNAETPRAPRRGERRGRRFEPQRAGIFWALPLGMLLVASRALSPKRVRPGSCDEALQCQAKALCASAPLRPCVG